MKYRELINESNLTLPSLSSPYPLVEENLNDQRINSPKPKYFFLMKYFLAGYLLLHILFMIATLPNGISDLRSEKHEHTDEIHTLWIISIIYSSCFSVLGLLGIFRESFVLCFIFCIAMLVNLLILVYAATLHKTQTTAMIVSLLANWFFTCVAIAYTKLIESFRNGNGNGSDWLESSPGYLHSIYIRQAEPFSGANEETPSVESTFDVI